LVLGLGVGAFVMVFIYGMYLGATDQELPLVEVKPSKTDIPENLPPSTIKASTGKTKPLQSLQLPSPLPY